MDHEFPICSNLGQRVLDDGRKLCSYGGSAKWISAAECRACPVATGLSTRPFWVAGPAAAPARVLPCIHRGAVTREAPCELCGTKGRVEPVLQCDVHGECTANRYKQNQTETVCLTCADRVELVQLPSGSPAQTPPETRRGVPAAVERQIDANHVQERTNAPGATPGVQATTANRPNGGLRWSYGVTTTPGRRETLLPRTLSSLAAAGFPDPLLAIDGCDAPEAYRTFGLRTTSRSSRGHNYANWWLTAIEVYLHDPFADRYAMFEDDFVISRGAREYLEATTSDVEAYYSLFTWPENDRWARGKEGWFLTNQRGRGAVGLVFSNEAFRQLLSHDGMVGHARDQRPEVSSEFGTLARGKWYVDGLIHAVMQHAGRMEYCHTPSLIQHLGTEPGKNQNRATTFRGEEFDLRTMLH